MQKIDEERPIRSNKQGAPRGIVRVYGWTGVLMIVAFLLSGVWTLALAVVQIAPSEVANLVMGTAIFDNGDFWTLQKASDGLAAIAAATLGALALGYFGLVIRMVQASGTLHWLRCRSHRLAEIRPRDRVADPPISSSMLNGAVRQRTLAWELNSRTGERDSVSDGLAARVDRSRRRMWLHKIVTNASKYGDAPAFALPKLLLQTTILFRYLREGFPQITIFFYASLLVLNWMISTYCAIIHLADPRAVLVRIFYSFDLFFAVFAPLQAIMYAYDHFYFDNAEFATRIETLKPANFDVIARLFADPSEVAQFRAAFRSLQHSSIWSLTVKVMLNVLTIHRWWRTIRLLGDSGRKGWHSQPPRLGRVDRIVGALFFALGGAVFVYTIVAVVSSSHVCEKFTRCKAPSYRWNVGVDVCSCSVFVDRQTQIKTFDEWESPIDTTANLATLAASGDLKVIQIINRKLSTLPVELRRCTDLEQLILIYTKTTTIPDWAHEFTNLEYLHIEGDLTATQLQALPHGLFQDMPRLSFLHLGSLRRILFVPDLDRLPQLKYLMLAMLHSLSTLPSLETLSKLEQLNIIDATHVPTLPSIGRLKKLRSLVIGGRDAMCCNGFMTGVCDLTDFSCRDRTSTGEPRVDCVSERIAPSERAIVKAIGTRVCEHRTFDLGDIGPTRASSDSACGGVMFNRCQLNGIPGMCYSTRMMVIECSVDPTYEALRRLQIGRGVGAPCDPNVERWLGCGMK